MKKVRSSETAIPVMNWVKTQFFPVSIVKRKIRNVQVKTIETRKYVCIVKLTMFNSCGIDEK